MPLLNHTNVRAQEASESSAVGTTNNFIGNTTDGNAVYLTGSERRIAVEADDDVVWDDVESITVSSTAIGLTDSKAQSHTLTFISVEAASVRYWINAIPTATAGHNLDPGDVLTIKGTDNLDRILFIRRDASDATLRVSYGNRV